VIGLCPKKSNLQQYLSLIELHLYLMALYLSLMKLYLSLMEVAKARPGHFHAIAASRNGGGSSFLRGGAADALKGVKVNPEGRSFAVLADPLEFLRITV
jgi:hypothetical protein